ncbi:MAG: aromatic ring-hydroxylating dioxygenase subunit alpha [Chitinophagales bacterium]|nr:aromatic ring-hydroxylating dioxygenase subunit alpha [Chitinophagales bacterium]MDW8418482.1 aromatic ring-hydroxylating dioxygenase subunit alpha [Chitinophagales bacterium]
MSTIASQWYLVCFEDELKPGQLLKRKICGEEVVAYRTASGQVAVLEDRCCHRNVHLSLGYVQGERIKCGYHGWEFGASGRCEHIPSLPPDEKIPRAACIKSYEVQVKHRAVWAYFGDEPLKTSAQIPPFSELDEWPMVYNYHTLKANIRLVAESLFDSHHINHVHRHSIKTLMGSLRYEKPDYHLQVTDKALQGWYYRVNDGSFFEKLYFGFQDKVETHFGFWFPHSSKLDIHFPAHFTMPERRLVIYEHFYEIDAENVMMIQITTWKNIFRFNPWFAKWFMLRKSMRIVEEDIAFLESNKHWHDRRDVRDMLIQADELTFAFTRLWNQNLKRHAPDSHPPQTAIISHTT